MKKFCNAFHTCSAEWMISSPQDADNETGPNTSMIMKNLQRMLIQMRTKTDTKQHALCRLHMDQLTPLPPGLRWRSVCSPDVYICTHMKVFRREKKAELTELSAVMDQMGLRPKRIRQRKKP